MTALLQSDSALVPVNMYAIFVTELVSHSSGWLNAEAPSNIHCAPRARATVRAAAAGA